MAAVAPPANPIATLADAKAWLGTLTAGGSTGIGSAWFGPAIAKQVFSVLPGSDPLTLDSIAVDSAAATLSGTTTIVGEDGCTADFSFTGDADDPLLVGLTVALPADRAWSPISGFDFEFVGMTAHFTPDAVVGAVKLEFDCKLKVDTTELDAALTLPAVPGADWTVSASGSSSPSAGLLTKLAGGTDPLSVIGNGFALDKFTLSGFEMVFNPKQGCRLLKLGLDYHASWTLFGGAFEIDGFSFDFNGYAPFSASSFQGVATAHTKIGTVQVDVGVQFPDAAVFAHLSEDYQLPVSDVFSAFHITLPASFPDIEISTLSFALYAQQGAIDFALGIDKPFPIVGTVALDFFHFDLGISYGGGSFSGHGDLIAQFTVGAGPNPTAVELKGAYDSSGSMSIEGDATNIHIGDLIDTLLGKFNISPDTIPQPIKQLELDTLTVLLSRNAGVDQFKFTCRGHTTVAGKTVVFIPEITVTHSGSWSADFKGTLELSDDNGTMTFGVEFAKLATATFITASYSTTEPLGFGRIAGVFGFSLPPVPSELDLDLVSVTLRYDFGTGAAGGNLTFGAASANPYYGAVSYVSAAPAGGGGPRQHVFILATKAKISLSDLPLVGKDLSRIGNVALDDIAAAIAYPAPLDKSAVPALNSAIQQGGSQYPLIPADGLTGRILLSAGLILGSGNPQPVSIALGSPPPPPPPPSAPMVELAAAGDGDGTKWFQVQKSFGPVSIQKVGLRYSDNKLWALMNAGLEAGPVNFGLIGLGVGSPLKSFHPTFTVEGVTLSVAAGPMKFSGALVGQIDPVNLYGELGLSLPGFSIGALGGYAEYQGHPSCFLFAVLDAELGGPPFFFVTGLAAGFGLNRNLVIPPVGSLASFPLIQWATGQGPSSTASGDTGDQVQQAMTTLADSGVIAPSIGEYWMAAGVQFTSFELVSSFALLTVKAGNEVEIDLLGLSTLTLPPDDPSPIAMAQLALEASFSPAHHEISVMGQLTPASFVLSQKCHLTGGFAFCMWYGGDYEGDFVLSLGGYSPRFSKPDHYPAVPRLGLNWQITDNLTISGDEYFALTPSAVMAGGGLSAVWSSGDISAWFSVEADFLLLFNPVHYYISASMELGASVKIDLWFTSFTITIHLGVSGEFWGPDFGGEIDVDLDIVSFTISVGSKPSPPPALLWGDFVSQVLPSRKESTQLRRSARLALADGSPSDNAAAPVVQINAPVGIVKTLPPVAGATIPLDWTVDAETIVLAVASTIPMTAVAVLKDDGNVTLETDPHDHGQANTNIGVGPSQIAPTDFTSVLTITASANEPTEATIYATQTLGGVPKAVWEQRNLDSNGVPSGVDPLNNTVLAGALKGYALNPKVPDPQKSLPIPLRYLQFTDVGPPVPLAWSAPSPAQSDPFSDETVHGTIADSLATANRTAMISAIQIAKFDVDAAIDITALADAASGSLLAAPRLRYLGEAR